MLSLKEILSMPMLQASKVAVTAAMLWLCCSSVVLRYWRTQAQEEFFNPLEIITPDPLLRYQLETRPLNPERLKLTPGSIESRKSQRSWTASRKSLWHLEFGTTGITQGARFFGRSALRVVRSLRENQRRSASDQWRLQEIPAKRRNSSPTIGFKTWQVWGCSTRDRPNQQSRFMPFMAWRDSGKIK